MASKRFALTSCIVGLVSVASQALGSPDSPKMAVEKLELAGTNKSQLHLVLQDTFVSPNACPYYVQSFQYVDALKTILITTGSEPCLIDVIGRREAELYWVLPGSLRSKGEVTLVVNGENIGKISWE